MKKVLALGYLPKWRGGKQSSGLATGLFDLHDAINEVCSDIDVTIAATDIFKEHYHTSHTNVLGWTKVLLCKHMIKRFYRLPFFFFKSFQISRKFSMVSMLDTFVKIIFFDYAIEKVNPDIIHLHGAYYALFINALWKNKKPVVLRLHGINGFDSTITGYKDYQRIEKNIINNDYSIVTFVTSNICEDWKLKYGCFKCPMIPIINGYNKSIFYAPNKPIKKEYDLITISGIQERKGQGRVLEALKMLKEEGTNLSYLIVGDGHKEYVENIKSFVVHNNLNVDFLDYCPQDQIKSLLWKAKWFIQPSASEGFGKTYIESAAAGTPFILPSHLPIVHEKNIVSKINSVVTKDESAQEIYNTLKNIDFSTCYNAKVVSNSVAHLSWQAIAEIYAKIYQQV